MNKENKEKYLTEAEQRRVERFEKITEEMKQQGYVRRDLTIGMGKANAFAVILLIPLFVIGYGLYFLIHRDLALYRFNIIVFIVVFLALIVVHELIHGLCWSIFTPHRFQDIEFGLMKPSMTPYCTCLVPLKKQQHIFGTAMPFLVLGLLPMIMGIVLKQPDLLFLGIMMADGAAGDLMVISRILAYKSEAKEIVYMDHPTEAGCVVFER